MRTARRDFQILRAAGLIEAAPEAGHYRLADLSASGPDSVSALRT